MFAGEEISMKEHDFEDLYPLSDLSKKLIPKIYIIGITFNEYEDLHLICFSCGKYGQRLEQCTEAPVGDPNHQDEKAAGGTVVEGGATTKLVGANSAGNSNVTGNHGEN
ncbi:hypothetical protein PIB30_035091 [Stylosanthes scabra]|uniref:CCHC-type domain-containing protein n=1 Tax=Stylosanthes scabra TaxID=79078 RepID=A0ABU6RD52_9FABA|nr:hypothetical protein [Stylosanthes scabra]